MCIRDRYDDIFEGSVVIEAKTAELAEAAMAELAEVEELGGAFEAIDELKRRLVRSQAERVRRIESGEDVYKRQSGSGATWDRPPRSARGRCGPTAG